MSAYKILPLKVKKLKDGKKIFPPPTFFPIMVSFQKYLFLELTFLCMKSNLLWDFCQTELPKSVCMPPYLNLAQIRSEHRTNYSNFSSTSVALCGSFRFILKRHWSFLSEFGQLPSQSSQCKTHSVILHLKLKNDPYTTAADSQNSFTIVGDHWVPYFEAKSPKSLILLVAAQNLWP